MPERTISFDLIPDAIVTADFNGLITQVNSQLTAMFGYQESELIGQPIEVLLPERVRKRHIGHRAAIDSRPTIRPMGGGLELHGRRKDGTEFPVDIMLSSLDDGRVLAVVRDTTIAKNMRSRLTQLAYFDSLTGLPNRAALYRTLDEFFRADRDGPDSPTSIALFDLDGFKEVNDTMGHSCGDACSRRSPSAGLAVVGSGPRIFRLGGDEFILLVLRLRRPRAHGGRRQYDVATARNAVRHRRHDRLRQRQRRHRHRSGRRRRHRGADRQCRHGALQGEGRRPRPVRVLSQYAARRRAGAAGPRHQASPSPPAGRVRALFPAPGAPRRRQDRRRRSAAEMESRPIPDRSGRFHRDAGGKPDLDIGRQLDPAHGLRDRGFVAKPGRGVAARRSQSFPSQYYDPSLVAEIEQVLADTGLAPDLLELEITENIALGENTAAIEPLRKLRDRGVRVALDDFGTGYASLSFLTRMPLTDIKIDQTFVRGLPDDPKMVSIVRSLIAMAHISGSR